MSKQIIFVGGKRFTVITDESEAYMRKITDRVETRLKSISSSNPKLDRDSVAILACLDYCDEENKLREGLDRVKSQIKDYLEDSNRLHKEITDLKVQNMELTTRLDKLLNNTPKNEKDKPKEKKLVAAGKIENNVPKILDGAVQQTLFNNE
jgi:cell division protein ZapA (FtsZ GTPase activity inhibitor)